MKARTVALCWAAAQTLALLWQAEPPVVDRPGDLCGIYSVAGKVADGTPCSGVCLVSKPQDRDAYVFAWLSPAGQQALGVGHRSGNTLAVAWKMPVPTDAGVKEMLGVTVYTIREKRLTGRWISMPGSGVAADETLTYLKAAPEED